MPIAKIPTASLVCRYTSSGILKHGVEDDSEILIYDTFTLRPQNDMFVEILVCSDCSHTCHLFTHLSLWRNGQSLIPDAWQQYGLWYTSLGLV